MSTLDTISTLFAAKGPQAPSLENHMGLSLTQDYTAIIRNIDTLSDRQHHLIGRCWADKVENADKYRLAEYKREQAKLKDTESVEAQSAQITANQTSAGG